MSEKISKIFSSRKLLVVFMVMALVVSAGVSSSWALLHQKSNSITNTFEFVLEPDYSNSIKETFSDGVKKSKVSIKNDGTRTVYIAARLVSYRVNESNEPIGGAAPVTLSNIGAGWLDMGDNFYVYSLPVKMNKSTTDLIGESGITLEDKYEDADGGKQVIDVLSQSVKKSEISSVADAWKVTVGNDGKLSKKS